MYVFVPTTRVEENTVHANFFAHQKSTTPPKKSTDPSRIKPCAWRRKAVKLMGIEVQFYSSFINFKSCSVVVREENVIFLDPRAK